MPSLTPQGKQRYFAVSHRGEWRERVGKREWGRSRPRRRQRRDEGSDEVGRPWVRILAHSLSNSVTSGKLISFPGPLFPQLANREDDIDL